MFDKNSHYCYHGGRGSFSFRGGDCMGLHWDDLGLHSRFHRELHTASCGLCGAPSAIYLLSSFVLRIRRKSHCSQDPSHKPRPQVTVTIRNKKDDIRAL